MAVIRNNMVVKRKSVLRRAAGGRKRNKQEILEANDVRDWAGLHDYLLEDVLGRLPLADCFIFGRVCDPWKSVAANYLDGCDRRAPCFVKRGQNEVAIRSCFNVLKNSNFEMELPKAHGRMIFGSFQDWLFLGRSKKGYRYLLDISLLNPFSGENIILPETSARNYIMVLSAVPSGKDCVCMLAGAHVSVSFWTPGAREWHIGHINRRHDFLDALYSRERFYILNKYDEIVVINKDNVISWLDSDSSATFPYQLLSLILPVYRDSVRSRHYLVESRGEILLVSRFFSFNHAEILETSAFEIYKLNLHEIAWLKLENLEDQILFVGNGCSRSFHANDLGVSLANNVYFANDSSCVFLNEWSPILKLKSILMSIENDSDEWGVFCTQKPNHWPSAFRANAKLWAGVWLTAPIRSCLKKRRC